MTPTAEPRAGSAERRLEWKLRFARLAILWERAWPALMPPLGVAGLFLAVTLFDVWSRLQALAHLAGLFLFGLALAGALWQAGRQIGWPSQAAARRRIETRSELPHRPLTVINDRLAGGANDAFARSLWQAHRARAAAALQRVHVGWPQAGLARHDPWGLGAGLVLILFVALGLAGEDAPRRLHAAFAPGQGGSGSVGTTFHAWIAPPAYTGLAPVFLTRREGVLPTDAAPLAVPTGSALVVRVHGGRGTPRLALDDQESALQSVDDQNHQASRVIAAGSRIALKQGGRTLAQWRIRVIADQPPDIAFRAAPKTGPRGALEVAHEASDDYALAGIGLEIRLGDSGQDGGQDGGQVAMIDLPTGSPRPRTSTETSFHDLTSHPWAGLPVRLTLVARDDLAQEGRSDTVAMLLPERHFSHPVARAVIEQRKRLAIEPGARSRVAFAIGALALVPETYGHDTVAHLALSVTSARLIHDRSAHAVPDAQELLWETALRIEDGTLSQAERDLRTAQRELMDALARNAPDAEIERLVQQLREAMERFFQALAQQALDRMARGEPPPEMDPNQRSLSTEDLMRMLDRAQDMARSGARDAARDLLAQLQRMMENLREGRMARRPSDNQQGSNAMRELGEMMRRQQELLDRSFRRGQQARPGERGPPQMGQPRPGQRGRQPGQPGQTGEGDAAEQEALRGQLGEFLRRLGEAMGDVPGALGQAERSMRDAREALQGGEPGDAVGPQTRALDQLREGAQAMMEQMQQQMQQQGGGPGENGFQYPGRPRAQFREDPLGRPYGGQWDDGDSTRVPDKSDLQRSRDILEELQRRSGDSGRPALEREYIDRLLRRF